MSHSLKRSNLGNPISGLDGLVNNSSTKPLPGHDCTPFQALVREPLSYFLNTSRML